MYIDVSSYKGGNRVGIIERQKINGRWSNRLIKHIGTPRDDDELAILKKIAQTDRIMLSSLNQLDLDLGQNPVLFPRKYEFRDITSEEASNVVNDITI